MSNKDYVEAPNGSGKQKSKGKLIRLDSQKQVTDPSTKEIVLGEDTLTVGRDKSNVIHIDDPHITRYHAVISYKNGRYSIQDLGSKNGTLINDKKIKRDQLESGDIVTFAEVHFKFVQTNKTSFNSLSIFGLLCILIVIIGVSYVFYETNVGNQDHLQVENAPKRTSIESYGQRGIEDSSEHSKITTSAQQKDIPDIHDVAKELDKQRLQTGSEATAHREKTAQIAAVKLEQQKLQEEREAKARAEKQAKERAAQEAAVMLEQQKLQEEREAKARAEKQAKERAAQEAAVKLEQQKLQEEREAKARAEKQAKERAAQEAAVKLEQQRLQVEQESKARALQEEQLKKTTASTQKKSDIAFSEETKSKDSLTGRQILDEVTDRHERPYEFEKQRMTLIDERSGSKEIRKVRRYYREIEEEEIRVVSVFHSPAGVKGVSLLTWKHKDRQDDQWLYLPAQGKRMKRIAKGGWRNYFMGTDYTYEDLASEPRRKFKYTVIKHETYDNQPCFVIKAEPTDPELKKKTGYKYRVLWIRKDIFAIIRTDFYDRKERLIKRQSGKNLKHIDDRAWRSQKVIMEHLKNKHTTITEILSRSFNKEAVPEKNFKQRTITSGRILK